MKTNGINGHKRDPKKASIQLESAEASNIRALEDRVRATKIALADLTMNYEQQKVAHMAAVQEAIGSLLAGMVTAAKAHGIDPNDSSKGRWNLDTSTMTFTRTD